MNEKIKNYINKEYLSNKKIFIISTVLFIINYLIKHFFTENKVIYNISDSIYPIFSVMSVTALILMTYNVLTLRAIKKIEDGKDV